MTGPPRSIASGTPCEIGRPGLWVPGYVEDRIVFRRYIRDGDLVTVVQGGVRYRVRWDETRRVLRLPINRPNLARERC